MDARITSSYTPCCDLCISLGKSDPCTTNLCACKSPSTAKTEAQSISSICPGIQARGVILRQTQASRLGSQNSHHPDTALGSSATHLGTMGNLFPSQLLAQASAPTQCIWFLCVAPVTFKFLPNRSHSNCLSSLNTLPLFSTPLLLL